MNRKNEVWKSTIIGEKWVSYTMTYFFLFFGTIDKESSTQYKYRQLYIFLYFNRMSTHACNFCFHVDTGKMTYCLVKYILGFPTKKHGVDFLLFSLILFEIELIWIWKIYIFLWFSGLIKIWFMFTLRSWNFYEYVVTVLLLSTC